MDAIATSHHALQLWDRLLSQVEQLMAHRGAHATRTVVLVPYAQLMPLARRLWARRRPDGFAPRFDTTMNWAARLGFSPGETDLGFDMARDLLTARHWLERAGLGTRAGVLAGRLVEAAWQLAGAVAAVPPHERVAWAAHARAHALHDIGESPVLALEAAVARIALEWAAASAYASDALWRPEAAQGQELIVVLQGLEASALSEALARHWGERAVSMALDAPTSFGELLLHEAADPSHEAEMAAACVVRHIEAGRVPVALAAVDRLLTRRIRPMLEARGIAMRDETGWKLSTTRAAAGVMGALRACAFHASSDEVLDWLKQAPAAAPATVSALERRVRRFGLRDWSTVHAGRIEGEPGGWARLIAQANAWREPLQPPRALGQWQRSLCELLHATRQWDGWATDSAGAQVMDVLGLSDAARGHWADLPQAMRRMTLAEFTAWANDALEAGNFIPDAPAHEQVAILPFNQLLARPFPALVLPGCDELRLAPSPEPPGAWTAAQRTALGLPAREALEQALRAGWRQALATPHCDVLWRRSDDSGEPVLPSPLVQQLRLAGAARAGEDPRQPRALAPQPVARPQAVAAALAVEQLSASGYEDLRRCPYRFFALRQLGLQEAAEIDADLDKRDFGNWLHQVLGAFHAALAQPDAAALPRAALLDQAAAEATRSLGLADGEFLPFSAAWPQVRDGYLAWLARHEAETGARFDAAERELQMPLGTVRLVGRIDRIDRLPDGRLLVMDYKTESRTATADRVRAAGEDTQLAFYAALLEDDSLRAAYVNVGERGKTETIEQVSVVQARDALVEGILHDLARIAGGAVLPALGEGRACEFCAARGLCRRDFWS